MQCPPPAWTRESTNVQKRDESLSSRTQEYTRFPIMRKSPFFWPGVCPEYRQTSEVSKTSEVSRDWGKPAAHLIASHPDLE